MHVKKLIASLLLIAVSLISFLSFPLEVKSSGKPPEERPPEKIVKEETKQEREQRNSVDKIIFEGKYAEIDYFWMKENNDLAKFLETKIRVKGGKVIKKDLSEHNLNEWNYVRVKITQQAILIPGTYSEIDSKIEIIVAKKIEVIVEILIMKRETKDSARAGEEIFAIGKSVIISDDPVNAYKDKEKALGIAFDNLWILK